MTNQEKKQYLSQYRTNNKIIARLTKELKEWKSTSQTITTAPTGMPRGGSVKNPVLDCIERASDLEERLMAQINLGIALREKIERAIDTVEDQRLRLLLQYRYLDGETFEQIAVEMDYCWRQICNLHGKALKMIQIA